MAGHLEKSSVKLGGVAQYVNVLGGSVKCGGVHSGDAKFFNLSLILINQKQPKVTC